MPKKPGNEHAAKVEIPFERYEAMVATMKELAARNTPTEAIVLRCAKAGGINEVVKHIVWLRNYIKKHPRLQRAASEGNGLPKPRGKKKSTKKRTPPPPQDEDHDMGSGAGVL